MRTTRTVKWFSDDVVQGQKGRAAENVVTL